MGKIQIRKQSNNTYRFLLIAGNGLIILTSEPHRTKDACLNAIDELRINAAIPNHYEFKKSFNHKHYFNLLNSAGAVVGSSEMYESSSGRDLGVSLVKANAPDAVIEDLTS